jgi:hypothetical protein
MTARGVEHLVRVVILLLINKKIKINIQIIVRRKFSKKPTTLTKSTNANDYAASSLSGA